MHNYSIVEAKNKLSQLVNEAENGETVNLTRRGKQVAVLLSIETFQKINQRQASPAEALNKFLNNGHNKNVDVDPSIFNGLRARTSGRDIKL